MSSPTFQRLRSLLATGPKRLSPAELLELERLYRVGHRELAVARQHGTGRTRSLETLLSQAQGRFAAPGQPLKRSLHQALRASLETSPRVFRQEWRLVVIAFVVFYGLAAIAYAFVAQDQANAFVFLDPAAVQNEIDQLQALAPGEAFRGNFTFGFAKSSEFAGMIIANNIGVTLIFFAAGLLPPLFVLLLGINAFMLGTYIAVAADYGQAGSILSILCTHGMLELQAIVLAGCAGAVLFRALIWPGVLTRSAAIQRGTQRALLMLEPVPFILIVAGLIEGYVSPNAGLGVRTLVALVTSVLFLTWLMRGGRTSERPLP